MTDVSNTVVSKLETALWTKAVVAIWVVFVPEPAVGAVGVPVNVGLITLPSTSMFPLTLILPLTSKAACGFDVPIPTLNALILVV